jgi:hypothetical protein
MLNLEKLYPLLHEGRLAYNVLTRDEVSLLEAHNARVQAFHPFFNVKGVHVPTLRRLYVDMVYHTMLVDEGINASEAQRTQLQANLTALVCMVKTRVAAGEKLVPVSTPQMRKAMTSETWSTLIRALHTHQPYAEVHRIIQSYYGSQNKTLLTFNEFVTVQEFVIDYYQEQQTNEQ